MRPFPPKSFDGPVPPGGHHIAGVLWSSGRQEKAVSLKLRLRGIADKERESSGVELFTMPHIPLLSLLDYTQCHDYVSCTKDILMLKFTTGRIECESTYVF
jgi:hypothetical protein